MRIRLVEAAQPIEKLKNNIITKIIPEFNKYGLGLETTPNEVDKYEYVFRGNSKKYGVTTKLRLFTTAPEIDIFNEENPDLFTADLFVVLRFDAETEELGCISSKDASSVDYAMENIDLTEYLQPTEEEIKKSELILPKADDSDLPAMTAEEWVATYKDLERDLDGLREQMKEIEEKITDPEELAVNEEYNKVKDEFGRARKYLFQTFPKIYPEEKVNAALGIKNK